MPEITPRIEFEQTTSFLLEKVATAFRNTISTSMEEIGLHRRQAFILMELWKEDGQRQVDLANRLSLAAATISKSLTGMAAINLIRFEMSDVDARTRRVFLTPTGRRIRSEVEKQWIDLEESCLSCINEVERLVLVQILNKLRARFTGEAIPDPDESA